MKRILALGRSGEGIGLLAGLLMLAARRLLFPSAFTAPVLLAVIVSISSLAAFVVAVSWRGAGGLPDDAVRKGVLGAAAAAIVAAACFVLLGERSKTPTEDLASLVAGGLSVLPAMLAGLLAAVLAALSFAPNRSGSAADPEPPPAPPKALQWGARVTIGVLAVWALATPFYARQQAPLPRLFAPRPNVPATPPFDFKPPAEMASAHALQWVPAGRRTMGRTNGPGVAFTRDERWIAFIEQGSSAVRIIDILSSDAKAPIFLPFPAGRLAFNQEGDKLFAVSASEPQFAGVVDISQRQFTILPKPKEHAIPGGDAFWKDDGAVLLGPLNGQRMTMSLASLETDPSQVAVSTPPPPWTVRLEEMSTWNASPAAGGGQWRAAIRITSAELPETTGTSEWQVRGMAQMAMSDPNRNCAVLFPGMDVADRDVYFPSSDGSRIVRLRDSALEAFYFGLRPAPPLAWTLNMPHGPEAIPKATEILEKIDSGRLLALVCSPMVNPLTGKVVGPDRERVKGRVAVKAWTGTTAHVTLAEEFQPFSEGDIVADLHTAMPRGFELHKLRTPYRWWTALPQPGPNSTSPDNIPTLADFRKRGDEARRVARAAEEKKREEEREKEREREAQAREAEKPAATLRSPSDEKALGAEIGKFLKEHHMKASEKDPQRLVQDYADEVDHFSNGIRDRTFIYRDEWKYRQGLRSLTERLDPTIEIRPLSGEKVEVRYTMRNEWVTSAGKAGSGAYNVTVELAKTPDGWKISKQRSTKKP
ncbi:MAG TPA: hypothetical protein VG796_08060 [Verrucomicrobiales bacterium]|nr:hypothetical protein [Verrucomicrobiales bacterium]